MPSPQTRLKPVVVVTALVAIALPGYYFFQAKSPSSRTANATAAPEPRFVKKDGAGQELPAASNAWTCIHDRQTGLVWETKTSDGGLHDQTNLYTWYEPDALKNGGKPGFPDMLDYLKSDPDMRELVSDTHSGESCNDTLPRCNTRDYAAAVNREGWCGYHDWRVPEIDELMTLVDYRQTEPAINGTFFPDMDTRAFWSATTVAGNPAYAWQAEFIYGAEEPGDEKSDIWGIRLVRGTSALASTPSEPVRSKECLPNAPRTAPDSRYTLLANGLEVLDRQTRLVWQRCDAGSRWDGKTCSGQWAAYNLGEAREAARKAGNGWRIPELVELRSLAERACHMPAQNVRFFPPNGLGNLGYWSVTPSLIEPNHVWSFSVWEGKAESEGVNNQTPRTRFVRGPVDPSTP